MKLKQNENVPVNLKIKYVIVTTRLRRSSCDRCNIFKLLVCQIFVRDECLNDINEKLNDELNTCK